MLFSNLGMGTSLAFGAGICHSHGSSDGLDWCSWLVGEMELALTSAFFFFAFSKQFFQGISVPTLSVLEVIYFLSRNMVRLDVCQSHRKPGLIGSALPLSDFLDGFVCVCVVCCCVGFSVCLLFLNPSAHFGA